MCILLTTKLLKYVKFLEETKTSNTIYVYLLSELSRELAGVLGFKSELDRIKKFEQKKNSIIHD